MVIFLVVCLLVFFISLLLKSNKAYKDSFKQKYPLKLYNILTIIAIIMAVIQAPLFYYYTAGFIKLLGSIFYVFVALVITGILINGIVKYKYVPTFHKHGTPIAILIGTASLLMGLRTMEELDWKMRLKEREQIVEDAKKGLLNSGMNKFNYFPPISNLNNEVFVYRKSDEEVTVEFYVDRGFIDHYTAFIFTTDSTEIRRYEEIIEQSKGGSHKIKEHWYRIAE